MLAPEAIANPCPVRSHVELLHRLAAGVDGVLVVSVFYANPLGAKDTPGTVTHHRIGDIDGMVAAITAHAETPSANVYAGLQVMRPGLARGSRGTKADIVAVLGLVADMDSDTGKVGELPLEPSYVIETSPGNRQPCWLFERPLSAAEGKPIAKALQRATSSDSGTGDVAHVWRIPGTLNWPNKAKLERGRPPEPALVSMFQPFAGELVSADRLRAVLEPYAREIAEARPVTLGAIPDASSIAASYEAEDLLAANDVGDRSTHASRVVERLAFDGHSVEDALALFMAASGDWTDRYPTIARQKADFVRLWSKFRAPHEEERQLAAAAAQGILANRKALPIAANDNHEDGPHREHSLVATDRLADLTRPGGVIQDLIDWIVSSAEQPSRELALAAVLPFIATLIGRRYSTGNRDTRANLYVVALAESGFGKEHARTQLKRLVMSAHGALDKFYGAARIMSASALREALEHHPAKFFQIDEFGGFVRDITEKHAGSHQKAISTDLRDYYSASSTFFEGAAYAGKKAVKIINPCLCIHGTSTPVQFWEAVSSASAEDGLLPRMVLFDVKGKKPAPVEPSRRAADIPMLLLERLIHMAGIDMVEHRLAGTQARVGKGAERATIIRWTPDAELRFAALRVVVDAQEPLLASEAQPFIRRVLETATKLAMIASVSADHTAPVIGRGEMDWACRLAWTTAASMIGEVQERLSDSPREAAYKKVEAIIKAAGPEGISPGKLADKCRSLDKRLRTELVADLRDAGRIEEQKTATSGRPRHRLVWRP